jgi:hypothetical protein
MKGDEPEVVICAGTSDFQEFQLHIRASKSLYTLLLASPHGSIHKQLPSCRHCEKRRTHDLKSLSSTIAVYRWLQANKRNTCTPHLGTLTALGTNGPSRYLGTCQNVEGSEKATSMCVWGGSGEEKTSLAIQPRW